MLIRTTGRPSLLVAVQSVCNQWFKEWELIVVNASGRPLEPIDPACWAAIHKVIEPGYRLGRALAANMLLDAACGQYAIFLDDDDWFLEDHLAKLVPSLDEDPDLIAAYADVECIDPSGPASHTSAHRFERDFDRSALQLENYLPIHAVLFRLAAVRAVSDCRFEPSLELFEDWDFWLQLAAKGAFKRVPGISAIYALSVDAGSGHTEASNVQRSTMLERLADRQLKRWQAADVVALTLHEVARSNLVNQEKQRADLAVHEADALHRQLEQLQQFADARELQLAALNQALRDIELQSALQQREIEKLGRIRLQHLEQLNAFMQSTSWRMTRPLRSARGAMLRIKTAWQFPFGRNVLRALRSQVARHGILGFLHRIPYFVTHRRVYFARMTSQEPAARVDAFAHPPPQLRNIRLHPDLCGGGATIDAKVSVVIPTFNAGPEFAWMLRKLRAQKAVREIEIVVVDSGSGDATADRAREAGAHVVPILQEQFTHSYARNLGADHASGDYLLFMVQDAYPIGEYWMYGILRYLIDNADEGLVAASCAEYSRADSDMMYDSMINTHYRFLGCLEVDRIGRHKGDDHVALRSQGQLSDVSCLIFRDCFQQFRYRGNYAEDLDLGIRLIKSGRRVAMLASIKVIHSHNRPAYYYLKRAFVDVVFLVGLFDDFTYPRCQSLAGLVAGIGATARQISNWLIRLEADCPQGSLGSQLDVWIAESRRSFSVTGIDGPIFLGDDTLDAWIATLPTRYLSAAPPVLDALARSEIRQFNDSFLARLEHFNGFAKDVYGAQDLFLRKELGAVVSKTFAAAAGSALAFYCLDPAPSCESAFDAAKAIRDELTAGI